MKRLVWLAPVLAVFGCGQKPCQTSTQCGSGEVCASATCQALSCDSTWDAVDPSTGLCRPLPACGNKSDVSTWKTCNDPCVALAENACIADPRCQPGYVTTDSPAECSGVATKQSATPGLFNNGFCAGSRSFSGCHANPLVVDPCDGLNDVQCRNDPRCVGLEGEPGGCFCPANSNCNCPAIPAAPLCRIKTCGDFTTDADCRAHPDCTTDPGPEAAGIASATSGSTPNVDAGVPLDAPFVGCFEKGFGSCYAMDQAMCLRHGECHPVGAPCYCPPGAQCKCGGGAFLFCEPDDGLPRCNRDSDCSADQRCNNDEICAPPIGGSGGGGTLVPGTASPGTTTTADAPPPSCAGQCVPRGCAGNGEARCYADPACQPTEVLNCSPYGGGGFEDSPLGCSGISQGPSNGAAGTPAICGGPCEPTFNGCLASTPGAIDPGKSILVRDPTVVDDPRFAFPTVMARLAGGGDAAGFVEAWLDQIGTAQMVNGRSASARAEAAAFFAGAKRTADGKLDLAALGLQTTSLSNRLDLSGAHNCGEARLTYALAGGVTDRRHRMTVIVELAQPDDGHDCRDTAQSWIALSSLSGAALADALFAIYDPLLAPAGLNQVRTNEFLVGPNQVGPDGQPPAWELREWRLGTDGQLHLSPSKQALDPKSALDNQPLIDWVTQNRAALLVGAAVVPDTFLAVTSSENGSRIRYGTSDGTVSDSDVENAFNKQACAGCHTTETNSAFTHVAERFQGSGRAQISEMLRLALPARVRQLDLVSRGAWPLALRLAAKPVH